MGGVEVRNHARLRRSREQGLSSELAVGFGSKTILEGGTSCLSPVQVAFNEVHLWR